MAENECMDSESDLQLSRRPKKRKLRIEPTKKSQIDDSEAVEILDDDDGAKVCKKSRTTTESKDGNFPCKVTVDVSSGKAHTDEGPFACTECDQKFGYKHNLDPHVRAVHRGERSFACTECDKKFSQKSKLQRHVRAVHRVERPFACPECNKKFSEKHSIDVHLRSVHRGERRFPCTECDKTFGAKSDLERHVRAVHRKERPFECAECNKIFASKCDLERHIRGVHRKERPFECVNCDKIFATKCALERHLRTVHRGEKPNKNIRCTECDKKFATKQHFDQHVRAVHRKERPFECVECASKFAHKHGLDLHILAVHRGEKPFFCMELNCEYKTAYKESLKKHHEAMHTKKGQDRQKRSENRLSKDLEKGEFKVDARGQYVPFTCFTTSGKCAYIDFVLYFALHIALVENDEDRHEHYPVSCEWRRQLDVVSSLRCGGDKRPIVFVRFNPDPFTIDGQRQKVKRQDRLKVLFNVLHTWKPKKGADFGVVYLFYDQVAGEPAIFNDPEFPQEMKNCVEWH